MPKEERHAMFQQARQRMMMMKNANPNPMIQQQIGQALASKSTRVTVWPCPLSLHRCVCSRAVLSTALGMDATIRIMDEQGITDVVGLLAHCSCSN